jgi:hypothetical protein
MNDDSWEKWSPVIGRSLALIALHMADLDGKSISDRAFFLQSLGLPREDIAFVLGSSPASIAELMRQRGKKAEQNGKKQTTAASKSRSRK